MTRDEVTAAVGGLPGDYSDGWGSHGGDGMFDIADEIWLSDDADLKVWYGDDGRVRRFRILEVLRLPDNRTSWTRLREWIGL